jgi:hypothetical protein
VHVAELSVKRLESTARLFLIRRKLLKRGHNKTLSKAVWDWSSSGIVRLHASAQMTMCKIWWQRAAQQLHLGAGGMFRRQRSTEPGRGYRGGCVSAAGRVSKSWVRTASDLFRTPFSCGHMYRAGIPLDTTILPSGAVSRPHAASNSERLDQGELRKLTTHGTTTLLKGRAFRVGNLRAAAEKLATEHLREAAGRHTP